MNDYNFEDILQNLAQRFKGCKFEYYKEDFGDGEITHFIKISNCKSHESLWQEIRRLQRQLSQDDISVVFLSDDDWYDLPQVHKTYYYSEIYSDVITLPIEPPTVQKYSIEYSSSEQSTINLHSEDQFLMAKSA